MKRNPIPLAIILVMLALPLPIGESATAIERVSQPDAAHDYFGELSSAGDSGAAMSATAFMSRNVDSLQTSVLNSYASSGTHSGALDLSDYLIPGWTLYNVSILANTITAAPERETMGITPNGYIRIRNNTGQVTDALYQAFYSQPHDGKLENYTFSYLASYYLSSLGDAYLGVRSNFSDSQTNTTGWTTPFVQGITDTSVTHDCSADNAVLNQSTYYYVVIDGTKMTGTYIDPNWYFNTINWRSSTALTGLETGYSIRDDDWYIYEGGLRHEAELNYTYTPWNKTASEPLVYSQPDNVSLSANSTALTGLIWTFASDADITRINFGSSQSVDVKYNLTLRYRRTTDVSTDWFADSSGSAIAWNATTSVSYPAVSEIRHLYFASPSGWTVTGLYNSSDASTNYDNYTVLDKTVKCTQMTNGSWTLTFTAHNHLTEIQLQDPSNISGLSAKCSILVDLNITSRIAEEDDTSVVTSSTNLTIWKGETSIWKPVNKSVVDGSTTYSWNITSTTFQNGLYTIEISWANGTEAGYRTTQIVVYYPTQLAAEDYLIDGYTENSFAIGVYFNDTYTPQGVDGTQATVTYSFDGGDNTTMFDHNNGTWSASVSTTGKSPGIYQVNVFAEGFALENKSATINVTLIHETQPLTIQWSDGNDITYVESTDLVVVYRRVNGQNVSDAFVNVTISSVTYALPWEPISETYRITFSGADVPPGFGAHGLAIQAWKSDHLDQSDNDQILTLREEPTNLGISWSNGVSITYVESTVLSVSYTMSNNTPIPGANANVTIGTKTWILDWNSGTETYDVKFNGSDIPPGFGIHSLSIQAWKKGYDEQIDISETLTLSLEPTSLTVSWSDGNNITYVQRTTLIARYRMSNGTDMPGALVNVTIGTDHWLLTWNPIHEDYRFTFYGSDVPPGFGTHNLNIQAWKNGYEKRIDNSETIVLRLEPTSLAVSWSNGSNITYVQKTTLIVHYRMSNGSVIPYAQVNVTIGGTTWSLMWIPLDENYQLAFNGTDVPPGFGTHNLNIQAWKRGYEEQIDNSETIVLRLEPTSLAVSWSNGSNITYVQKTTLIVHYRMSNGSVIPYAQVNVTIGGTTWSLMWIPLDENYQLAFNGTDVPPGFGTHSLSIEAWKAGYQAQSDPSEQLILRLEPTNMAIEWSNSNNITYVEYTVLSVNFTMSNNTPVVGAIVNATIGSTTWILTWNPSTKVYDVRFDGGNESLGIGMHPITIMAWRNGYENKTDITETLTIRIEPTIRFIVWNPGFDVTYTEYTTFSFSYWMSNGTAIPEATVNVTIGASIWDLRWNPADEAYQIRFNGSDNPPGFGIHNLNVKAWKKGYQDKIDSSQWLTLREEPTVLDVSWSEGNNITYAQHTILIVNYTMTNGTAITDATLNVTIGSDVWLLVWNGVTETYETTFYGSSNPPGLGTHNLVIGVWKFGYEERTDSSQELIFRIQPTTLNLQWSDSDVITYVESTTLTVGFAMSNGTVIPDAMVNATIGTMTWVLNWNPVTEEYELMFHGDDDPPSIGSHALTIEAWRFGYEYQTDNTETLTIVEESTLVVTLWSNGNNIGYFEHTVLDTNYRMSNGTSITDATVNVTIEGQVWQMTWNATAGTYQVRFDGSDNPPGPGTHSLTIRAWKHGYQDQTDSSATLTLPPVPTIIQMNWTNGNNITYLMSTVLMVNYTMFNGTTVTGATINVTIGSDIWALSWNGVSKTYDATFNGNDEPPGLGTHALTIRAWAAGFEDVIDSSQTMTLREEPTSVQISWSDGSNITYVEHTTLLVGYLIGNGSAIPDAQVNVTIGGTTWSLIWVPLDENYQLTFNGTDEPPGFGTHALTIRVWKFGYESTVDTTQDLIIGEEDTTLTIQWSDGDTISYVGGTTATVRYRMSNGTAIIGATVNMTIGTDIWILNWNGADESYQVTFSGSDNPPGLGAHALLIQAWKAKYQAKTDGSQVLTINKEVTSISLEWSDGTTITFVEHTILSVNYTMSNGSVIVDAWVNVTSGVSTWQLAWDDIGQVYKIRLNGSDDPPGFGTHGLAVRAWKAGYESRLDSTQTLVIQSELGSIESEWLPSGTITYVEFTVLSVNFTMSNGTAVSGAMVNATIGSTTWNLVWHGLSETYRIRYNGSDEIPGFGSHGIMVNAWKNGYDLLTDSTKTLVILVEPATITVTWLTARQNNISYFEYTLLSVRYRMSNGTDLLGSIVNVTIGGNPWELSWNGTEGAYTMRFNGSDSPPGFGVHTLTIQAWKYGYQGVTDVSQTLIMRPDPTTIHVTWTRGNDISYIEYTTLSVNYRMSNGSEILDASVSATTGSDFLILIWNATAQAYQVTIYGVDDPPGLGTFVVSIAASKLFYADQNTNSSLTISAESTSLAPSWSTYTFDWVENVILSINYTDSLGTLIGDATQRDVVINGTLYSLQGTNGTYWIELDNTFDLGYHTVEVNISKHGYDVAFTDIIRFDIVVAESTLTLDWTSLVIDYMGQMDLTSDYTYDGTNAPVPAGLVTTNITIDGLFTLTLNQSGSVWTANLTGMFLDLGSHNILVKCWAYGYEYQEQASVLQVNNVTTDALALIWQPANVTIEYTSTLNLTVDYTYYGGDVPDSSILNVTINGRLYNLTYLAGAWHVSIPCDEIGVGIHDAMVSAWNYGYASRTNTTSSVNITLASNSFWVFWEPASLNITYMDHVNVSVVYTQDFQPLLGATVKLSLNGSRTYDLVYDSNDEMWHITLEATEIGLGEWNATLTANKTGFSIGSKWDILIVRPTETQLLIDVSSLIIYYDETSIVNMSYQMANGSIVPGGLCTLEIDGAVHAIVWQTDHWEAVLIGALLGEGTHHCIITTTAPGYESITQEFDIVILLLPTQLLLDTELSQYENETVGIWVQLNDTVHAALIDWANVLLIFEGAEYALEYNSSQQAYRVDIWLNPTVSPGIYTLIITAEADGYADAQVVVSLTVNAKTRYTLVIEAPSEITEDSTLLIEVLVSSDSEPASGLDVEAHILATFANGTQIKWVESSTTNDQGIASIEFDISAGITELEIWAEFLGSVSEWKAVSEERIVIVRSSAVDPISILIALLRNPVTLSLVVGTPSAAILVVLLRKRRIPTKMKALRPRGSEISLAPVTGTGVVDGFNIMQLVGSQNLVYNMTRKGHFLIVDTIDSLADALEESSSHILGRLEYIGSLGLVTSITISAKSKGSLQVIRESTHGEDRLRQEIMTSDAGLTRADLSNVLGLSSVKVGSLVRDLLTADSRFYEVREGKKRFIRFRSGD